MLSSGLSNKKRVKVMKKISKHSNGLNGTLSIPSDKSISHRALIISSFAKGISTIKNLLESEDIICTATALKKIGIEIEKKFDGTIIVKGGTSIHSPSTDLYMGNSGTSTRLLFGALSQFDITANFMGDQSLSKRPMNRIIDPLTKRNDSRFSSKNGNLPIKMIGAKKTFDYEYTLPIPSAQLKSALLSSGIIHPVKTIIHEPELCRDHTERMLLHCGANIQVKKDLIGNVITLQGGLDLKPFNIEIPGDISSAAFPIVAAAITPNSNITVRNVGINPLRIGILDTLQEMGAKLEYLNKRIISGEPVADIRVFYSQLTGITIPAERAPSMIDEYPIIAIAASFAKGKTIMKGLSELKVKESNRFEAIVNGLRGNGVQCNYNDNDIEIQGNGKNPCGLGKINAKLDHRIAMSFLVMGMATENPVEIDDISSIATSFPNFVSLFNSIGACIT